MSPAALRAVPNPESEKGPLAKVANLLDQLKKEPEERISQLTVDDTEKPFEEMEAVIAQDGENLDDETLRRMLELEAEGVRLKVFPILRKLTYFNRIKELLGEEPIDFFGEKDKQ